MAERLTRNNKVNFCFHDEASNIVYYKLQNLEDIMEKYGIESLDILEQELKIAREIERLKNKEFDLSNSAIVDKDFYKDLTREIEKLETDRDIWKRACESMAFNYDKKLTCNTCYIKEQCSKQYGGNYEQALCNYFYQQAKTDGMMSKEELIEEISDIRKQLYKLQEENIDVNGYELGFVVKYLDDACEVLGELKEYLIRLLGEQQ